MDKDQLGKELRYKAVRSGGAGGQHVNKVSTKIELSFDLMESLGLSTTEKDRLKQQLKNKLNKEGVLLLQCDETRSQLRNKELVTRRFLDLLENLLKVQKKRKKTKPSRAVTEKRLKAKQKTAEKKAGRKKPDLD